MKRDRPSRWLLLALMLLLLPSLFPHASAAQSTDPQITSMQEKAGLSDVEARRLRFLFWGYAVIWILISAYLVSLGFRLRSIRRELTRLRSQVRPPAPPR